MKKLLFLAFNGMSVALLLGQSSPRSQTARKASQGASSCHQMARDYAAGRLSIHDAHYYQRFCLSV